MLSLAGFMLMIDKMNNPEKDYHTETASLINSIPAHKIDKKTFVPLERNKKYTLYLIQHIFVKLLLKDI